MRPPGRTEWCTVTKKLSTDATRGSYAEQDDITAAGVVQQLDELVQHYGDGGNTHAMLHRKQQTN